MKQIFFTQGEVTYELGYGLGNWAASKENEWLEVGDCRVIGGVLMCVYIAKYRNWGRNEYSWVPVDTKLGHSFEELRKWKNSL